MPISKSALSCYVLMPFNKSFDFVYDSGIKPALEQLLEGDKIEVERADDVFTFDSSKVEQIKNKIKSSDLIVIDVSGFNTNVIWEFGYCQALNKHIIPISQPFETLPFNFSNTDVIKYEFSPKGLITLKDKINRKLSRVISQVTDYRRTLKFDFEIVELIKEIEDGLGTIRNDSILRQLAKKDIERLGNRIKSLKKGMFDLRNEKPNKEIIRYFCDYISQLDDETCTLETVTFFEFWDEITEETTNWDYLKINVEAVEKGVVIKRIFIVDDKDRTQRILDEKLKAILRKLHQQTTSHKDKMQLYILFSEDYKRDCDYYKNFGLMKKGTELLLFRPEYLEDGQMKETKFYYYDESKNNHKDNKRQIDSYSSTFNRVLDICVELKDEHLM